MPCECYIDHTPPPSAIFSSTTTMEHRHSSPSPRRPGLRPSTSRQRSNSLPTGVMDALGCSTTEAELIMREGRAALHRRRASGGRGRRIKRDDVYRPKDHLQFLQPCRSSFSSTSSSEAREDSMSARDRKSIRHSRILSSASNNSNATDSSITTVLPVDPTTTTNAPKNILVNYSANLAKFIQSQLSSIPSYHTATLPISPCSCPDFSFPTSTRTPPLSPTMSMRRPFDIPHSIAIPPVRPPMVSAFSEWSSTDDDEDDELLPMPTSATPAKPYTPSALAYPENNSSFLFSSTPSDDDRPDTAKAFTFPNQDQLFGSTPDSSSPSDDYPHHDWPLRSEDGYPTHSSTSTSINSSVNSSINSVKSSTDHSDTNSVASPFGSVSTAAYFDYKLNPKMRASIIAAVTPPTGASGWRQIIPAISPFDGAALSNVHDVLVESQQRVCVDGMCFDMLREFNLSFAGMSVVGMGLGARRVGTPC